MEGFATGQEVRTERECAQQQQSIGQVQRKINRTRRRAVVRRQPQQNQQGAQQCLVENEHRRRDDSDARKVSCWRAAKDPNQQDQDRNHGHAGAHAVSQFDQSGQMRMGLHHDAVAHGPVAAAAVARSTRPDKGPPHHHQEVEGQHRVEDRQARKCH